MASSNRLLFLRRNGVGNESIGTGATPMTLLKPRTAYNDLCEAAELALSNWASGRGMPLPPPRSEDGWLCFLNHLKGVSKEAFVGRLHEWTVLFSRLCASQCIDSFASFSLFETLSRTVQPRKAVLHTTFYWLRMDDRKTPMVKFGITNDLAERLKAHAGLGFTSGFHVLVSDARAIEEKAKLLLGTRKEIVPASEWDSIYTDLIAQMKAMPKPLTAKHKNPSRHLRIVQDL